MCFGCHAIACGDKVRDINLAGARLAREAVAKHQAGTKHEAWVAGSVGPLGIRIEPLGKTSLDEARDAFRAQIAALVEGGVDLLILETFGYLEELHQAILAARDVSKTIPIVAQVTIDEDGNCLDGSEPETFTAKLDEWGADVIGCNCSVGPVAMLGAIERMAKITAKPLSAQPNAGMPRSVEGRNIYLCSPEYMANFVPDFLAAGVKPYRRLLRHDPRAHPHHEADAARRRGPRTALSKSSPRRACRPLLLRRWPNARASEPRLPTANSSP